MTTFDALKDIFAQAQNTKQAAARLRELPGACRFCALAESEDYELCTEGGGDDPCEKYIRKYLRQCAKRGEYAE